MNPYKIRKSVKGFTLIEMIVVIAIIGILLAILMPSLSSYFRKARIQTANSEAKMVYNAAQTAAQRYISADRTAAAANVSGLSGTVNIMSLGGVPACSTGANAFVAIPPNPQNATPGLERTCSSIAQSVNRTVADGIEICWAVRIDNYIVKASVAAANESTTNCGSYSSNRQMETIQSVRANNISFRDGGAIRAYLETIQNHYDSATSP